MQVFTKSFLKGLAKLDDPIEGAATMRGMVTRTTSHAHRRQLIAGRIALLALQGKIEAEPEPEIEIVAPVPEPVVVPTPKPPAPVVAKKPPQTSILSLEDAAALFSAFSMSDPDDPPAAPGMQMTAPEPTTGTAPDLQVIEAETGTFAIEMIEGAENTPFDGEATEIPQKTASAVKSGEPAAPKKKSKKATVAQAAVEKAAAPPPETAKPQPKPAAGDQPVADGQRAKRSGESRIISADGVGAAKPKIDFSALADLGGGADAGAETPSKPKIDFSALADFGDASNDAADEEPAPVPDFKAGLKIDMGGSSFLADLSSLTSPDDGKDES